MRYIRSFGVTSFEAFLLIMALDWLYLSIYQFNNLLKTKTIIIIYDYLTQFPSHDFLIIIKMALQLRPHVGQQFV